MRPKVLEKDIDKILIGRFSSDKKFCEKFLTLIPQFAGKNIFDSLTVKGQAPHCGATGTIDIFLNIFNAQKQNIFVLLLENKLDSSFTPNQPERYAASATALSKGSRPALAVLCAPQNYIERSKHTKPFNVLISYECISDLLDGDDRVLILDAIRRFEMPYEPDPVPQVMEFFRGYEQLAATHFPELVIKKNPNTKGERPEASRTIYFVTARTLPRYDFLPTLRFSHQCWDSNAPSPSVKVMFADWGNCETALRKFAADDLANTPFYLRKAGRSLGLVHDTPRLNNMKPVGVQDNAVLEGLRAASKIRAWMFANETVLKKWAHYISEQQT